VTFVYTLSHGIPALKLLQIRDKTEQRAYEVNNDIQHWHWQHNCI